MKIYQGNNTMRIPAFTIKNEKVYRGNNTIGIPAYTSGEKRKPAGNAFDKAVCTAQKACRAFSGWSAVNIPADSAALSQIRLCDGGQSSPCAQNPREAALRQTDCTAYCSCVCTEQQGI